MTKQDQDIIESLSPPAKRLFYNLDGNSKRRILKQAKELATRQMDNEKKKSKVVKKDQIKREQQKVQKTKENTDNASKAASQKLSMGRVSGAASFSSKALSSYKDATVFALGVLLTGQSVSEESYGSSNNQDNTYSTKTFQQMIPAHEAYKSSNKVAGAVRNSIRKKRTKAEAQKAGQISKQAAEKGVKAAKETGKKIADAMKKVISALATNPVTWVVLLVILIIAIIAGVIGMIVGGAGAAENTDSSTYQAQVSEEVEAYRDTVAKYCEQYEIPDYVDLCLAVIQQESSGNPPDVMQTEQSYYNVNPPIDSAEESIDCGVHELADCLTAAKSKDASDITAIKLALQGYNFGNGYIAWAQKNYGGYSRDNAAIFSKKMCNELGYSSYGDIDYVPHVLRYYVANEDANIENETAKAILAELKENNDASEEVWNVISKGATLIGKTEYSMSKRQADGRDHPEYLDCSSFTAWAFHKAGITSVPYASSTATFLAASNFETISAAELKPGDIGLKNNSTTGGGSNHVGIYCGKLKNGTKVWLHCTSNSGSNLTENDSGPMFGAYTNFTVFRRLKKWK